MAGMAIISPTSVVNSALEIPWARSCGFTAAPATAISENALIIPCTVPSSPTMGLIDPIRPM